MLKVQISGTEFLVDDKYHTELMTVLTNAAVLVSWARGPNGEYVRSDTVPNVSIEPGPMKTIAKEEYEAWRVDNGA